MAVNRKLFFNFIGDSDKLDRASKRAGGSLDKLGTKADRVSAKMGKIGKNLTTKVSLPIVAAFGVGIKSLAENEALMAQTEAVLKSTGNAANVTADEVLGLANEISGYSGVAHESILEGQNMLLTFTNVRNEVGEGNDVFDQATRILTDMSVATGQDMKSAAVQLGKAINDPIKGIAALNRVGVQFTKEQEEQIKTLVESGDVMEAQKIILAELETQFGGSAEAAGDTFQGQINKLKNSFEEVARSLAAFLIPILSTLGGWLQSLTNWFRNLSPGVRAIVGPVLGIVAAIGPLLIVGAKLIKMFQAVKAAFLLVQATLAANPFLLLIAAVVALVIIVVKNWDKIKAVILAVWEKIRDVGAKIWNGIKDTLSGIWNGIKDTVEKVWNGIKDAIRTVIEFVKNLFLNFTGPGLLLKHWDTIRDGIQAVVDFFREKWDDVIGFFEELPGRIGKAATGMWDGIVAAFKGAINTIIRAWNNLELKIGGAKISLPFGRSFSIPSITLRTPNIPTLHRGGIFRAPPGKREGFAVLRDRERVSEPGTIEAAPEREPLVVQIQLDGATIAEALIRHEEGLA
jgi:phage-related protein